MSVVQDTLSGLPLEVTGGTGATAPDNHAAGADYDDAVPPDGVALDAELAIRRLGAPWTERSRG